MIYEVRIAPKEGRDPKGEDLLAEIKRTFHINSIKNIRTAKVYRLEGVSKLDAQKFVQIALFEPIDQRMSLNRPIFAGADKVLEVAYRPGVMNPEAASLLKAARDTGITLAAADSSWEYAFFGKLGENELQLIINRLLVNETIEHVVAEPPKTLLISGKAGKVQKIPIRNLNDHQLMELPKDRLFLNLEEMKTIQNYFNKLGRDPTDCEVEVLAQTWSEHCVHKTFKAKLIVDGKFKKPLFERIKQTVQFNKKLIVSAFVDNSGVIDFYEGFGICGKVETHNSPSAIEPYGGAMTGSGGVFRDILGTGQGAKVVTSTDIFCFAPPDLDPGEIPPGCLHPDYLLRKVVAGVRDYGNRVGIPTNNGSIHFHKDFRAKPTVAVGSYGIVPKKQAKKQWPKKRDIIVTIGGRTGRDGIHGATFSSGEMTASTIEVSGLAVQIGNAIEEKRIIDAILVLGSRNLIRTLTDCGAGGYSSAIGEMGEKTGARVYLEKVPTKYSGLAPWEIFLSESQERMVIAVAPKDLKKVLEICKLYNVEATPIGKFDGSKRLMVTYKDQIVCDLDMQFLHHGLPQRKMIAKTSRKKIKEKSPSVPKDLEKIWLKVLSHGNVCSKEPIIRMYDHTVQGTNALHSLSGVDQNAPNDGVVIRPILAKPYGMVVAHGLNPLLVKIDSYWGSVWAVAEAVSNYVACGGDIKNAALIDNFIWPYPDEESLADLDESVDACCDMARLLGMPFVSGKDSLSSTYRYPEGPKPIRSETHGRRQSRRTDSKILKIPSVLLISVFGRIPDVKKTASADFKRVGSTVVLVGRPDSKNLGGTTYFDVAGATDKNVPKVDVKNLKKILQSITAGVQSKKILACHDISEGGLATALFEMCLGGGCGAEVNLGKASKNERADYIFFSETTGTFLVEVENGKIAKQLFSGVPFTIIGQTKVKKSIRVNHANRVICDISVARLKEAWQKPMKEIFH